MFKKILFCMLMYLCLLPGLFAETVALKSGQEVEGKLKESKEYLEKESESEIKIYGKVIMPSYKEGAFLITANRVIDGKEEREPISRCSINSPKEKYCLIVPKGIGYLNLYAFNIRTDQILPGTEIGHSNDVFRTFYLKNPIKVEDKDLTGINMTFFLTPIPPVMIDYTGPTVKVSGEVIMHDYKEGKIGITVGKDKFGPPTVTSTGINGPGKFEIEIAKNIGQVYIGAFNSKPGEGMPDVDTPQGQYAGNPLSIGEEDISNVVIVIEKK